MGVYGTLNRQPEGCLGCGRWTGNHAEGCPIAKPPQRESDRLAREHLEAALKATEWRLQQMFQISDDYKAEVERLNGLLDEIDAAIDAEVGHVSCVPVIGDILLKRSGMQSRVKPRA